jgi:hypothetical protein
MKRRIQISNLLFWGFLILLLVGVSGKIVYKILQLNSDNLNTRELSWEKYQHKIEVNPFDTIVIETNTSVAVVKSSDFVVASDENFKIETSGKRLVIRNGNSLKVFYPNDDLTIVVPQPSQVDIVAFSIDNLYFELDSTELDLTGSFVKKLIINAKFSDLDVAVAKLSDFDANLKQTKINIASSGIINSLKATGDSLSEINTSSNPKNLTLEGGIKFNNN